MPPLTTTSTTTGRAIARFAFITPFFQPLRLAFLLLGLVMLLFLVLPLATMILSVSPERLYTTLLEDEVWHSILLTITSGLWATFFGLLFGVPLAYLLARHHFPGKRLVEGLVDLPVVVPHTAA